MAFSDLFKKAQDAISNLRGSGGVFFGKDGDVVYSKNNVCVHEATTGTGVTGSQNDDSINHTPGYLTIHCQNDEQLGMTLVLQWLPNTTLEKNPASIRCVSPRSAAKDAANDTEARIKLRHLRHNEKKKVTADSSIDSTESLSETSDLLASNTEETASGPDENSLSSTAPEICVEMNGDTITVTALDRPTSFKSPPSGNVDLSVPTINVIPNTPVGRGQLFVVDSDAETERKSSTSSTTSGADDGSDDHDGSPSKPIDSSPCDSEEEENGPGKRPALESTDSFGPYCHYAVSDLTPEQFAQAHNLMLNDDCKKSDDCSFSSIAMVRDRVQFHQKTPTASLFSVNLGKMRSMRLFYSNPECTSGQLVIASPDSQYKILHFHHGGMDKLAQLFEQWNAIKGKSVKDGSPSPLPDRHFLICRPAVSKGELDPEDGLYERVTWDFWRSCKNAQNGAIEDSLTIRKAVYFASMEPQLRREAWPFLLRVYQWSSTIEQRETVRNDHFLEYQNIRKRRMKKQMVTAKNNWYSVENVITKDVVRTDRKNPYYAGENNPNVEVMKNILMNYAAVYPDINYIQGMSDLLAPILSTMRDETESYWCFVGLMQQTLFAEAPSSENNMMIVNLEYLRELFKLLQPKFFAYLVQLRNGDALQLMFVHRWILLFFKREFPESDALHIWEACWARYRTSHFHLFVCVAITAIYGGDVLEQRLPHDEILLYFASLAMHMDANIVLKKARGLLYQFCRLERIPCTLAPICQTVHGDQWDNQYQPIVECTQLHGVDGETCPFATKDF